MLWLFLAGCTTAVHVGKVPAALPLIREQWQLSLTQVGLVLTLYAVLIAAGGLMMGMLVQRIGYQRIAVLALSLVGIGSLLGWQSPSYPFLLFTRVLEGFGWLMAAIALPPLLSALSTARDQPMVMSIWGAFVPVGAGAMLIASPILQSIGGWQLSWVVAGVLSLLAALVAWLILRTHSACFVTLNNASTMHSDNTVSRFRDFRHPLIWVLSACFMLYTLQFISLTAFLPTLLIETTSLSLSVASQLTALVVLSNALGNVCAGSLLKRGLSHIPLLFIGAFGMGILAFFVFSPDVPVMVRIACAFGFSTVSGLIPGSCFATLPKAVSISTSTGLLIGLMMQGAGVGQLLAGVVIPSSVDYAGYWKAGGIVLLAMGATGAILALFGKVKESDL